MPHSAIAIVVVFVCLVLVYAAPIFLSIRSSHSEAEKLLRDGALGEAEILGYIPGRGGLWVEYQFLPNDSAHSVHCKKLLLNDVKRLPVGTRVPVRYKPGFPSISVLVPYSTSQAPS